MRAMILAAGRGERLRPLTDERPKPLIEVAGRPLIEHHLEHLAATGFTQVVINQGHLGGLLREALGNGKRWGLNIAWSEEPPEALETGGGIFQALPLLGNGPFAVINGDIWCDFPLGALRQVKCDWAHLVLVPNPAHNPDGDFALAHGRVLPEGERKFTFSGIAVYHPRFFKGAEAGRWSVVPRLRSIMTERLVTGEVHRGHWFDSGTTERLDALREAIR